MKLFGFDITRRKAVGGLSMPVNQGFWATVFDWKPGAWQADAPISDPIERLTAFSAVYACIAVIASDIAKLRMKLMEQAETKWGPLWSEVRSGPPWLSVLRKPNHFQTRIQFYEQWIISTLMHGNAYVLKGRDGRGVVTEEYVLDPCRVTPLVAPDGGVYYRIAGDYLSGVADGGIVVPASEVIHDRPITLWHPLIGVSPIFACGLSASQGIRIQGNSAKFFENMSRPSGMLTAPGSIDTVTQDRLKTEFEKNFGGGNLGRLLVAGDGLKYEPMTIPAQEAQLIEQLRWTAEDVARCFRVPLWKIGAGPMPAYGNSEMGQRAYYSETLQNRMEAIELLQDEGLELPAKYETEFDLDALMRMDTKARFEANSNAVGGGWMPPNFAAVKEGIAPAEGGDTPYLQQQNYSLAALARRDAQDDPFGGKTPPQLPAPDPNQASDFHLKALDAFYLELQAA